MNKKQATFIVSFCIIAVLAGTLEIVGAFFGLMGLITVGVIGAEKLYERLETKHEVRKK